MCRILILLVLFHTSSFCDAQILFENYLEEEGKVVLTSGIEIPKISKGYSVWLPDERPPKGLIVFWHSRKDSLADFIIEYATSRDLAVSYITTSNRLEFLFEESKMIESIGFLEEIINKYNIPPHQLLYCGMSLAGTRALKMAQFSQSPSSTIRIIPKAIAICDSPLDMVRFHGSMTKAVKTNFNKTASNEGKWVSGYLVSNLGGSPEDNMEDYFRYSPYSHSGSMDSSKLDVFNDIAIRTYTEPDIGWWMKNRGKDFYDMNSIDMAAFVNDLKIHGHQNAELITTENKGFLPDGVRHPHSWSIVDEKELIDWFLKL